MGEVTLPTWGMLSLAFKKNINKKSSEDTKEKMNVEFK